MVYPKISAAFNLFFIIINIKIGNGNGIICFPSAVHVVRVPVAWSDHSYNESVLL
jgi:hypothetical protein